VRSFYSEHLTGAPTKAERAKRLVENQNDKKMRCSTTVFGLAVGLACLLVAVTWAAPATEDTDKPCKQGYYKILGTPKHCRFTCEKTLADSSEEIGDYYTGERADGHPCTVTGRYNGACKNGFCVAPPGTVSE